MSPRIPPGGIKHSPPLRDGDVVVFSTGSYGNFDGPLGVIVGSGRNAWVAWSDGTCWGSISVTDGRSRFACGYGFAMRVEPWALLPEMTERIDSAQETAERGLSVRGGW